jgi:capsular polysaccharide transport system permease protein
MPPNSLLNGEPASRHVGPEERSFSAGSADDRFASVEEPDIGAAGSQAGPAGIVPSLLAGENTTTGGAGPLMASDGPELVRQTTIEVLTERIRLLGINRSGAYEHYDLQLQRGFPIPSYELAILDLVRRRLPDLRSYHEIGSGLGTLPFMLAYDGFAAVGVERDERRHLTATTILRQLSAQVPGIESNCRLFGAEFPDAVADLDVSDSLAILTDFVSSRSAQEYAWLCHGLAQYRYVLLDLQRFCRKRDDVAEQEQLVDELAAYGLSPCPEIIDLDGEGYYRLFECPARKESWPMGETSRLPSPAAGDPVAIELRPALHSELPLQVSLGEIPAPLQRVVLPPMPQRVRRPRFGGMAALWALLVIGIPTLLAVAYYGYLASSQYATTFQFAVRGPAQTASVAMHSTGGSLLSGASAMSPDAFVVTDYINSAQAVADVRRDVDLRAVYAKPGVDLWSRLEPDVSPEGLKAYWNEMVWAHFDLISGNVSVSVRAFTPQESLKLAQTLIAASNEMFRRLNSQAQQDFVRLADENLTRAQQQLTAARQALLAFRNKSGLVDPDKTAQASSAIVDDLRRQLAGIQAQYATTRAASPNSPTLAPLKSQIEALEGQIKNRDPLGSSAVSAVSPKILEQYQSLDLDRQFAEKQYTDALGLRDQAYLTAQNQQSYLALFVEPTLAHTSLYPDRPRAIMTVFLAAAAAWFVGLLLTYAVRDHLM